MSDDFISCDLEESYESVDREQLRLEDGLIGFAVPRSNGIKIKKEQTWECVRCGFQVSRPIYEGSQPISPDYCKNCEKGRDFSLVNDPVVITPEWNPPETVEPCPPNELYGNVREYITDHVNLDRECLYDGLAVWCLVTWHKEVFPFASHLCILAPTMSGKTRLCRTLSQVSYRGYNAGGSSESSLFRSIDGHDVTPFVSEFTGLPNETRNQIHNIIRVSQKKGEPIARSVRMGDQWVIRSFDTFTPMAVASQHDFPDDVKNRSIFLRMHPDAEDIEPVLREVEQLRDKLLFFRFSTRKEVKDGLKPVVDDLYESGVKGRILEQLSPLETVARICNVDLSDFMEWEKKKHRGIVRESEHVQICEVLSKRIRDDESLAVGDIVEEYNDRTESDWTSQKMGIRLKDLSVDREKGSDGRMKVDVYSAVETIKQDGEPHGVEVPEIDEQLEL